MKSIIDFENHVRSQFSEHGWDVDKMRIEAEKMYQQYLIRYFQGQIVNGMMLSALGSKLKQEDIATYSIELARKMI